MIAFMIAGSSSDVGKTTVATMMMYAFRQMGYKVQAFKSGPDYLDPTYHTKITGREAINLDLQLMGEEAVRESFYTHCQGQDVAIVEGVMGLYDGMGDDLDNASSAHLARVLGIPVILLVNGKGVSTSLAATVYGFEQFDANLDLRGVLLNRVNSKMLYQLLSKGIERYTDVQPFGYIANYQGGMLKSRHLGLFPAREIENFEQIFADFYHFCQETIDFAAIADSFQIEIPQVEQKPFPQPSLRLAMAKDSAFYFYYAENLEMLRARGVELVHFSPLEDAHLPENIDGIYLGGGYPELHLEQLAANKTMLAEIKKYSEAGMPIYGECGGLMYLSQAISDLEGQRSDMVGIFEISSEMTGKLQHFGYIGIELTEDCILGKKGYKLRGHEFHRSQTAVGDEKLVYHIHKSSRPSKQWQGGYFKNNTLAAYAHLNFRNYPEAVDSWVSSLAEWHRQQ